MPAAIVSNTIVIITELQSDSQIDRQTYRRPHSKPIGFVKRSYLPMSRTSALSGLEVEPRCVCMAALISPVACRAEAPGREYGLVKGHPICCALALAKAEETQVSPPVASLIANAMMAKSVMSCAGDKL